MEEEEDPEPQAEKPINATPYYCHICKIYCASPVNLQSHFLGAKHRLVEKALKDHGIVKPLSGTTETIRTPEPLPKCVDTGPKKPTEKPLEEQLNSCKDEEPALGLQYITEYQSKDILIYECSLCDCQSGLTNMFMHVLGIKHKLSYLKKHRPELANITGRGSNLTKKMKEIAVKVEREDGRKHIAVSMDLPIMKEDKYAVQLPDSLATWFTEDDVDIKNKKDDAKSSEEGTQKAGDINNSTKITLDETAPVQRVAHKFTRWDVVSKSEYEEHKHKNKRKLFGYNSIEFSNNEEVIKYLQTFEIGSECDASFILQMIQKLTNSLVTYRQKASEINNFSELNPEENVDQSELLQMTSGTDEEPNIGFSEKLSFPQHSSEDMGTFNPQNKRKASPLSVNDERKHFKRGIFASTLVDAPNEQASLGEMQYRPFSASDRNPSFPNTSETPTGSLPGPSVSKSHSIASEVAATLHKTTASKPSFRGMDLQKVIIGKIGTRKFKKIASAT